MRSTRSSSYILCRSAAATRCTQWLIRSRVTDGIVQMSLRAREAVAGQPAILIGCSTTLQPPMVTNSTWFIGAPQVIRSIITRYCFNYLQYVYDCFPHWVPTSVLTSHKSWTSHSSANRCRGTEGGMAMWAVLASSAVLVRVSDLLDIPRRATWALYRH